MFQTRPHASTAILTWRFVRISLVATISHEHCFFACLDRELEKFPLGDPLVVSEVLLMEHLHFL
jgi:hypothetical protein